MPNDGGDRLNNTRIATAEVTSIEGVMMPSDWTSWSSRTSNRGHQNISIYSPSYQYTVLITSDIYYGVGMIIEGGRER